MLDTKLQQQANVTCIFSAGRACRNISSKWCGAVKLQGPILSELIVDLSGSCSRVSPTRRCQRLACEDQTVCKSEVRGEVSGDAVTHQCHGVETNTVVLASRRECHY